MKNIDFLITTFDRYDLLERLLHSIFSYYPNAKVTIADQSKEINTEFYNDYVLFNLKVIPMPYDCGLSMARNCLVEKTKRQYKLILEDDFLFNEDTKVEKLLELMDVADIAGGGVYSHGSRLKFEHYFEKKSGVIYQVPDGDKYKEYKGIKYKKTGCVMNFALFNKVVFERTKWHNDLKLREHQHFFFRVKNKIVFTDDVKIVDGKNGMTPEYKRLKARDEFWKIALEDLEAYKIKYLSGMCFEIEGNKIVHYREEPII